MGRSRRKRKCIEAAFGQDPLEGYLYYNASNRLEKVQRFTPTALSENRCCMAIALLAYLGYPESIVRKASANLNENR